MLIYPLCRQLLAIRRSDIPFTTAYTAGKIISIRIAADQREQYRQHHYQRFGQAAEIQIHQQEHQCDGERHDQFQFLSSTLHVFKLTAPGGVVTRRELHLLAHGLLRIGDIAADVTVTDVDEGIRGQQRIFRAGSGSPHQTVHGLPAWW